jgi:preprotein translocase subunit SecY
LILLSCSNCSKDQQGGILSLFNMFSGGALSRFTIFALGIMPYISASIIMQLLTYVLPTFEQMKKRRRSRTSQDYAVHPLRHFGFGFVSVARYCAWLGKSSAGLVISPGFGFRMTSVVTLDRRHHVSDVVG